MTDNDILMHDAFESFQPGPVVEVVDGPFREMHAQPADPGDNITPGEGRARTVGVSERRSGAALPDWNQRRLKPSGSSR